jgi:hypothetical protein
VLRMPGQADGERLLRAWCIRRCHRPPDLSRQLDCQDWSMGEGLPWYDLRSFQLDRKVWSRRDHRQDYRCRGWMSEQKPWPGGCWNHLSRWWCRLRSRRWTWCPRRARRWWSWKMTSSSPMDAQWIPLLSAWAVGV